MDLRVELGVAIARAVEVHAAALVELSRSLNGTGGMIHLGPLEPKP